jgi:hypothetical protein
MVQIMSKINMSKSPWLDHNFENLFLNELSLAEDPISGSQNKPLEVFEWIHHNKAKTLLFKSLAELAPLFPLYSFYNEISCWASPPPSGSGNAVFIILGKDPTGKLRSVGGNYFNSDAGGDPPQGNFWENFSRCKNERDQYHLISSTMGFYKKNHDQFQINEIERICDIACTMPIYILALNKDKACMAVGPAIVTGRHPADFSYEKISEVTV